MPVDPRDPKVFTKRANEAWQVLMDGDFKHGLRLLSDLVVEEGSDRYRSNLGIANLVNGNCREAVENFREARRIHPFEPFVGGAWWLCGDHAAACEDWTQQIAIANSSEETYERSAGALNQTALLWWASARRDHRDTHPCAQVPHQFPPQCSRANPHRFFA